MVRGILLLLAVCLCPFPAFAGEGRLYQGEVSLFADTVWEGEITVDGILTVAPGVTLEIRPGTTIRFTGYDTNGDGIGEHEIFLQGRLLALGTAQAPIVFTAADENFRPGSWGAINIMASEEANRLEHCRVEYAYRGFHAHFSRAELRNCEFRRNMRGLQFQESTVRIENCRVTENLNGLQFRDSTVVLADSEIAGNYWGVRGVYSDLDLRRCRIEANLVNGVNLRDSKAIITANQVTGNRRGLYLQRVRETVVEDNLVAGQSEHGIFLEESEVRVARNRIIGNGRAGIRWLDSRGEMRENILTGNGEYALINDGAAAIEARGNWWGTVDPAAIAERVRDRADRPGVGPVDTSDPLPEMPAVLPARMEIERGSASRDGK